MRRLVRAVAGMVMCLVPAIAGAQGIGAASIVGVVKDSSGGVLPGVSVEAASPVLIERCARRSPTVRAAIRLSSYARAPIPSPSRSRDSPRSSVMGWT